jgi:hypothetical protein
VIDAPRSTSATLRYQSTLAVVSAGVVLLYLAYGRLFSIAILPPFGRALTTLAAVGVAVGGLVAFALRNRFTDADGERRLSRWLAAFGFAAPFFQIMVIEHVPVEQSLSPVGLLTLAAASVVLGVPFVLAGVVGVAALLSDVRAVSRRWGTVLLGASVGALLAVVFLRFLPATNVAIIPGAAACWLALLLAAESGASMRIPAISAVLVFLLGVLTASQDVFHFYYVRSWTAPYTEDVAWNGNSRVGVFPAGPGATATKTLPLAKGANGYASAGAPDFKWLDVDGGAWMPMLHFDGDLSRVTFLLDSVVYAAHQLRRDARVLIVGVGGGRDLLAARAANQRQVVGVEQNPVIRSMVEERYRHYSGGPYTLDRVDVVLGSPRRLLPGLADQFDIVQVGASTTGTLLPFLDDEGYLYTRAAFREYFRLLTPSGVLSMTRQYTPQNPLEVLRILATVRDAWSAEGVADPSQHVVVLLQEFSATVLARREPFTASDLAAVDRLAAEKNMSILLDPRKAQATPGADDATRLLGPAGKEFDAARYDVRATTDDWPFFGQLFRSATATVASDPFGLLTRGQGAFALVSLLAVVVIALAVGCLGVGVMGATEAAGRPPLALLVYFLATGYGAAALAVPLLERLRLLLGSDAAAVVAGAIGLGLAGAAGSFASARIAARSAFTITAVLGGASAVVALALARFADGMAGASMLIVLLVAVVVLVPLGAMLGMVVPLGIRTAASVDARLVAAAATLHAAGAVAGVAALLAIAMRGGMSAVVASAALSYGAAAVCLATVRRRTPPESQPVPSVAVGA